MKFAEITCDRKPKPRPLYRTCLSELSTKVRREYVFYFFFVDARTFIYNLKHLVFLFPLYFDSD